MEKRYGSLSTPSTISRSFYPVTSSILLRDTELGSDESLTVMTSRSQSGASLSSGSIELLHSRRLLYDDSVSKEIILNYTTPIQSTYYIQLFDRKYEKPLQREYQLSHIESPLEYFFNFDYWMNSFKIEN